ncbi:hypothetical protein Tco_1382255 [Tanacetum coccineum]
MTSHPNVTVLLQPDWGVTFVKRVRDFIHDKLVGDLAAIDTAISDKDRALLLLTSLPSSYDNFVETFLYGRDSMKLEDVVATLNSKKLQKMTEAKGDGGEGEEAADLCQSEEHLKRDCPSYNHKKSQGCVKIEDHVSGSGADGECRVRGTGKAQVHIRDRSSFVLDNVRYVSELRRNLISLGSDQEDIKGLEAVRRISYWVKDQDG